MAKKAIVWGRVSTIYQEIDAQVAQMVAMAKNEGYDEIKVIKSKGASAIKQNDLYKQEINELMTSLKNDSEIDAVYSWEVSRIARCELPFYTLKDYLVKHKINLIVLTPAPIRLFNAQKELDFGQEMVLNVLMTNAKQEMETKRKRFERGKITAKEKGKFGGGTILFGYKTDKDKNIIIDERESEIVREIFSLYLSGKTGIEVWQIVNGKYGVLDCKMLTARTTRIYSILRNYNYAGIATKTANKYPAIVTKETVDRAIERMKRQGKSEKHNTKHVFYGKGLLRTVDGHPFHPHFHNASYSCTEYEGEKYILNANAVDTIIWGVTCYNYDYFIAHMTVETKAENEKMITENEAKIDSLRGELKTLEESYDRLNDLYLMGNLTKEKYSQKWNALEAKKIKLEDNINSLLIANSDMKAFIEDNRKYVYGYQERVTETIVDENQRKTIIDKTIDFVEVEKIGKRHYKLVVHNKLGYENHYDSYYEVISNGNTTKACYHPVGNEMTVDVEITRRYSHPKRQGKRVTHDNE